MQLRASTIVKSALAALGFAAAVPNAAAEPITYQGRLTDAGTPANGTYDLQFRIYSVASGGSPIATSGVVSATALDGLVVATPDFPAGTFTGATVYLEVAARPTGAPGYTVLEPRQRITPAPLAMRSLNERWNPIGASQVMTAAGISSVVINDTAPLFADTALMVTRQTSAVNALGGMYVNTSGADGTPYYGWATGRDSRLEARVFGTDGSFHLGDWIWIRSDGNVALSTTPSNERLLVSGSMRATGTIVAEGTATASEFNYHSSQIRYLSIAPEAFHPAYPDQTGFFGGGSGLAYLSSSVGTGAISAGVNLPDGATVVGMDVYLVDNSATVNLSVTLYSRTYTGGAYASLANVVSSGPSTAVATLIDNSISNAVIDNSTRCYSAWVFCSDWQGIDTYIKGMRIRYTVDKPD